MGGEILENLWLFPFTINLPRTGGVNKIFQASLVDFGHLGGRKFMIVPFYNKLTKGRGCQQNLLSQLSGFWPFRGKEAQKNLLNVANRELFWKNST